MRRKQPTSQISPKQLKHLQAQPEFAFTEEPPPLEEHAQEPVEPMEPMESIQSLRDELPSEADPSGTEPEANAQVLQALEQLQQQIKLIRREQEYLLNVTESSQAFLETLSRELISVLKIVGKREEELPHDSSER